MKNSILIVLVSLALLGSVGCDDSDSVLDPPQALAQALAVANQETIAPSLNRFNLESIFAELGTLAVPRSATAGLPCSMIDACTNTGTWEYCEVSGGFEYSFSSCQLDGELTNGTIAASQGTATYAVSIDDLTYAGAITYVNLGDCYAQTLSNFTLSSTNNVTSVTGNVTYCPGSDYPTGSLNYSIQGDNGSFSVVATYDGSNTATVAMTDLEKNIQSICTVNIDTSVATCGLEQIG